MNKNTKLAIESAENEITFRNIDVSQFQENCRSKHRKQEEAVLEANTVGSMVFVHFIVDIIAFLVVYAIIGTLFQFVFSIEGMNTYCFGFLMVFSFVLYFQLWNLSFKTLGKL
jgi:uncharacterized protein YqhQ